MFLPRDEPQPRYIWRRGNALSPSSTFTRARLEAPGTNAKTGPTRTEAHAAAPLSQILEPMTLDPLTVADDPDFLTTIAAERNLSAGFKAGMAALY